jgi:hypothetical protein
MTFYDPPIEQTSTHNNQPARSNSVSAEQGLALLFGKEIGLGHLQNTFVRINSDVISFALINHISAMRKMRKERSH